MKTLNAFAIIVVSAALFALFALGCNEDDTTPGIDGDTDTVVDGDTADPDPDTDGDTVEVDVPEEEPVVDGDDVDPEPDSIDDTDDVDTPQEEDSTDEPEVEAEVEIEAEAEVEAEVEAELEAEIEPQCSDPIDCLDETWNVRCVGHWTCQRGLCVEECDDTGCGDGTCDATGGESETSCPADCDLPDCAGEYESIDNNECCPGLTAVDICRPGEYSCRDLPEVCTYCGNGRCDPYETVYNCPGDCEPCTPRDWTEYVCDNDWGFNWCVCTPGPCKPVCKHVGSYSEGWYDSCTDELFDYAACENQTVKCDRIGSRSEGWYSFADGALQGNLLVYAQCADIMECVPDPADQCPVCGDDLCEADKDETPDTCPEDCSEEPQCSSPADCADEQWIVDCVGHWSCERGSCVPDCGGSDCGDGSCDQPGGETPTSCAPDCAS